MRPRDGTDRDPPPRTSLLLSTLAVDMMREICAATGEPYVVVMESLVRREYARLARVGIVSRYRGRDEPDPGD